MLAEEKKKRKKIKKIKTVITQNHYCTVAWK